MPRSIAATYCVYGFSLAAIKYLGDVALLALSTGRFWKPMTTSDHSFAVVDDSSRLSRLAHANARYLDSSVHLDRRDPQPAAAFDAGRSPWWVLASSCVFQLCSHGSALSYPEF